MYKKLIESKYVVLVAKNTCILYEKERSKKEKSIAVVFKAPLAATLILLKTIGWARVKDHNNKCKQKKFIRDMIRFQW